MRPRAANCVEVIALAPLDSATHYATHVVPFVRPFTLALVASLAPHRAGDVLDHGAGTGEVALAVHARYPEALVTALDPNEPFLDALATSTAGDSAWLDLVVGRIEEQPWPAPRFDMVLSQLALMFVSDPAAEL